MALNVPERPEERKGVDDDWVVAALRDMWLSLDGGSANDGSLRA
jgi:hypothetical protein